MAMGGIIGGTIGGTIVAPIVAFLVVALIAAARPATGILQDGLPRPVGYSATPTTGYGASPPCYDADGIAAYCDWYGFSHTLYPAMGAICNAAMRDALANTTTTSGATLKPYEYYYSDYFMFDFTTNATYCLYGCFDLGATAAAPSPGLSDAPHPVASPPPTVFFPVLAPPASLFNPPPPALLTPSPPASDSPTTSPTLPALPPPLPNNKRLLSLNGAGFLRPTGLVSFVLSGALLILNGLVAL